MTPGKLIIFPESQFLIIKWDNNNTYFIGIWKIQQWQQAWKRSVFIPIPKKSNAKEGSSYCTIALISHTSKEMLKILQQYMNHDVQAGFKKGRGTRSNCQYLLDHWKTKGVPEKHLLWLSDFTFTFHFHALKKETATHSSVLAWRIPGTGEPGGLPSMGSHKVGHDWSDLAAARNQPMVMNIDYVFSWVS